MRIEVSGLPAPQGSKRHVGGGRLVESSRAVGPWREAVRAETQRACGVLGHAPLPAPGRPAQVEVVFRLPRPAGHYGTGRNAHLLRPSAPRWPATKKNDLDKLVRAVLDGLVAGGALPDDGQVVQLAAEKQFADGRGPGCVIYVTPAIDLEA